MLRDRANRRLVASSVGASCYADEDTRRRYMQDSAPVRVTCSRERENVLGHMGSSQPRREASTYWCNLVLHLCCGDITQHWRACDTCSASPGTSRERL